MLLVTVDGWEGWIFDESGYLLDPAGNKYLPNDLRAAWWARQAWASRAGYPGQLRFLHEHLRDLIRVARAPGGYVVEIRKESPQGLRLVQTIRLA